MTLRRSGDGGLYGSIEVLLTRMKADESETLIGFQSPWGGIHVREYGAQRFVEKDQSWWESEGFTVTAPPLLEEARRLSRERRRASSASKSGENQ
jgi:hypothetical protein